MLGRKSDSRRVAKRARRTSHAVDYGLVPKYRAESPDGAGLRSLLERAVEPCVAQHRNRVAGDALGSGRAGPAVRGAGRMGFESDRAVIAFHGLDGAQSTIMAGVALTTRFCLQI